MSKETKRQELIVHRFKKFKYEQRKSDGYYNATQMCDIFNKKFNTYYRSKKTQKFLNSLSSVTQICVTKLVLIKQGGSSNEQSTFIHPLVANHLAIILDSDFAVEVSFVTEAWKQGLLQYTPKTKRTLTEEEKDNEKQATLSTKNLNDIIQSKLSQEPDRIYQHVEDTIHAVPTDMSASYHKRKVDADNGMKILSDTEKDIYKTTKRMLAEELLKYPEHSLERKQIREIAKQVSEKCKAITVIHEQIGSLDKTRYLDILPEAKKKKLNLLK